MSWTGFETKISVFQGTLARVVSKAEVEVAWRPTVSQPFSLGVRGPSGTRDQFYFRLEIFLRQLWVCNFVAPCLTRRRVCNLLYNCFWALPEQSLLCRSPAELTAIFYSLIWDSPNLEGQVPVFISPRNRVAQLYPRALGSLCVASYDSQVCTKQNIINLPCLVRTSFGPTQFEPGLHLKICLLQPIIPWWNTQTSWPN
jgi:hypothetical protein